MDRIPLRQQRRTANPCMDAYTGGRKKFTESGYSTRYLAFRVEVVAVAAVPTSRDGSRDSSLSLSCSPL